MRRTIVGLLLGSAVIATPVLAQQGHWMRGNVERGERASFARMSPEDREAFADARIAALHAALKLNAEQEKLWPAVEQAVKELGAQRRSQTGGWRETRRQLRDDFPAGLRSIADRQATRAEALRRVADAVAPLYATFDEGQKRRAGVLMRSLRREAARFTARGGHDHHWRRGGRDG
ncbi:MAG TPA: Spy/CpxP family protein refolding chaperone [Beijerinckiaceae bacterium]|jgi:zinc resistance-associated protein